MPFDNGVVTSVTRFRRVGYFQAGVTTGASTDLEPFLEFLQVLWERYDRACLDLGEVFLLSVLESAYQDGRHCGDLCAGTYAKLHRIPGNSIVVLCIDDTDKIVRTQHPRTAPVPESQTRNVIQFHHPT